MKQKNQKKKIIILIILLLLLALSILGIIKLINRSNEKELSPSVGNNDKVIENKEVIEIDETNNDDKEELVEKPKTVSTKIIKKKKEETKEESGSGGSTPWPRREVIVDLNGGSGSLPTITNADGKLIIADDSTATKQGYVLAGWSTSKYFRPGIDNDSEYYQTVIQHPFNQYGGFDLHLYAVWVESGNEVTVNYSYDPTSYTYKYPAKVNIKILDLSNSWTKIGHILTGYSDGEHTYRIDSLGNLPETNPGDTITFTPDWLTITYTINYYDGGGKPFSGELPAPIPATYTYGDPAITLGSPTKNGYTFYVWNTIPDIPCTISTMFGTRPVHSISKISSNGESGTDPTTIADENNVINLYAHWERGKVIIKNFKEYLPEDYSLRDTSWSLTVGSYQGDTLSELNIKKDDLVFTDKYGKKHHYIGFKDSAFLFDDYIVHYYGAGTVIDELDIHIESGNKVQDEEVINWFKDDADNINYDNADYYFYTGNNGVNDVYSILPMYDKDDTYKISIPVLDDSIKYLFKGYSINADGSETLLNYDRATNTFSFAGPVSGCTDGTNWIIGESTDKVIYPKMEKIFKEFNINGLKFIGYKDENDLLKWAASNYNSEETNPNNRKVVFIYDDIEGFNKYMLGYFEKEYENALIKQGYTINGIEVYKPIDKAFYSYRYIVPNSGALYTLSSPVFEGDGKPEETDDVLVPDGYEDVYSSTFYFGNRSSIIDFTVDGIPCQTTRSQKELSTWAKEYANTSEHGIEKPLVWIDDLQGHEYLGYFVIGSGIDKGTYKDGIKEYSIKTDGSSYSLKYISPLEKYSEITEGYNYDLLIMEEMNYFTIDGTKYKTDKNNNDLIKWGKTYSKEQYGKELCFINVDGNLYLGFDDLEKLEYQDYRVNELGVYKPKDNKGYEYHYFDGANVLASPSFSGNVPSVKPSVFVPDTWDDLSQNNVFVLTKKSNIYKFIIGTDAVCTSQDISTLLGWIKSDYNELGYKISLVYDSIGSKYFALTKDPNASEDLGFTIGGIKVYGYPYLSTKANVSIIASANLVDTTTLLIDDEVLPETYVNTKMVYDSSAITEGKTFNIDSSTYYNVSSTCILGDTLISLPDGSKTEVKNLNVGDSVLTFDHFTGEFVSEEIAYLFKNTVTSNVIKLNFSNGTSISILNRHGFYCEEENKYVVIDANNIDEYIGKHFYDVENKEFVSLDSYDSYIDTVDAYSIVSAHNINHIANGILAISDEVEGIYNIFEYDGNMLYDEANVQEDINRYGLFSYEDMSDYCSESEFDQYNLQYLRIAIEKNLTTLESAILRINTYLN